MASVSPYPGGSTALLHCPPHRAAVAAQRVRGKLQRLAADGHSRGDHGTWEKMEEINDFETETKEKMEIWNRMTLIVFICFFDHEETDHMF